MGRSRPTVDERVANNLEWPKESRDRLKRIAAAQSRSVNAQLNVIIADYLASHDDTGAPLRNFAPRGTMGAPTDG